MNMSTTETDNQVHQVTSGEFMLTTKEDYKYKDIHNFGNLNVIHLEFLDPLLLVIQE